jgi:hypothetical protein
MTDVNHPHCSVYQFLAFSRNSIALIKFSKEFQLIFKDYFILSCSNFEKHYLHTLFYDLKVLKRCLTLSSIPLFFYASSEPVICTFLYIFILSSKSFFLSKGSSFFNWIKLYRNSRNNKGKSNISWNIYLKFIRIE